MKISSLRIYFVLLFAASFAISAQQLKPTEIIYSRLPNDINAPPTGANQPTIGPDSAHMKIILNEVKYV